ncbi:MAG TPA: SPOR domain-containing protein [Gammaproteobacteria bacterium]
MRILFFSFLLANLVLLLWHTQITPRASNSDVPVVPAERRLVLLTERQAEQAPDTAPLVQPQPLEIPDVELAAEELQPSPEEEPTIAPVAPILSCHTIGPFVELERAKSVTERIKQLGAKVTRRSKTEQEQYGYRVFLPPYKNREAALAATQKLAQNGIQDYFIISDADQKNGVSLGLFRKKSGAARRMEQVRRFDFNPQMEIRYRDNTIYWLDYEQTGTLVTESIWREITEETPNLQQLPRDCATKTA